MKNILLYGDSNTWGYNPENGQRFSLEIRYPGILMRHFPQYHFIEEAMNGRTTCFDDGLRPGRNGLSYLLPSLYSHSPLDLVVIMLGTNDQKVRFSATPPESARGVEQMIKTIKAFPLYNGQKEPKILLATPVGIGNVQEGSQKGIFPADAKDKIAQLNEEYLSLAQRYGCYHLNASAVCSAEEAAHPDHIHIDALGHQKLAEAFIKKLEEIELP